MVTLTVAIWLGVSVLTVATGSAAPAASVHAHGSAEQVYVTGLASKEQASLVNSAGKTLQSKKADSLGGLLFRNVAPGSGYRVHTATGGESSALTVHSDAAAPWDPSIYDQTIPSSGYGYLTTRDGTKLAIDVRLPSSPGATAPYPTLIEYAGYGYADPSGAQSGISIVANLMGFAVVDVNMRGTGCSGGAFNYFEALQNLDAYDVIETVAHQPWVLDHKVGMIGISYGAISQLFAAQLDPPALEAIAPLSTIDATGSTLYPGGILNTGFAVGWAEGRQHDAEPAGPTTGQPWAWAQIQAGDGTCKANQDLHGEAENLLANVNKNSHYNPKVADSLDPVSFVHKITVPVFMACQWEDEQTGGHCPDLVQHFTGTKQKWFTFTNGVHIDSLDPYTFDRWYDFLKLFVAHEAPKNGVAFVRALAATVYQQAMGTPGSDSITLPPDSIQGISSYSAALAAFEKLPSVRIEFDNGAGTSPTGATVAGNPYPGFIKEFSTYPIPGTTADTLYFGPGGALTSTPPTARTVNTYTSNAAALPLTDFTGGTGGGGLWGNAAQWSWNWEQNPSGTAVSYVSAPLTSNTVVVGAGAVYVWVRSSTPDVDLQATISEVRPDGKETFVQNGWIRGSERRLSNNSANMFKQPSTLLDPIPSFRAADARPMPSTGFTRVAIPLYYEGHVYRAGSEIRVTIAAPNGTQPVWSFDQTEPSTGTSTVSILFSSTRPSSLVLPVVPRVSVPTALPACPSLRNEPCRTYVPFVNG